MAPRFWYRPPGPLLRALGPLAPGKRARPGTGQKSTGQKSTGHKSIGQQMPVPVIAVTSLSLGGTGKTPAVIAIAQRLIQRGRQVHVVTQGAGRPLQVEERRDDPATVGDDPLLIAAFAPTWIAKDSADGVVAAAAAGAEIIVLDSEPAAGHISGAATVFVEDAVRGFGNGLAWPLGPLAQPVGRGLGIADLLIAVGPPPAQATFKKSWGAAIGCPIAPAQLTPLETGMEWAGLDVVAFAGIAAPERFFASLKSLGANLVRAQALSDHQELTPTLLARLENEAKATHAQLVTTEKDAVRLPRAFRQKVVSLPVRLELADWAPLEALLD